MLRAVFVAHKKITSLNDWLINEKKQILLRSAYRFFKKQIPLPQTTVYT